VLRAGYEALREAVVAGRPDGWRHGHGVLAGRGLAAWIAAWTALPAGASGTTAQPSPPIPSISQPAISQPSLSLSSLPDAGAVVTVLAEMALVHL
jgi:hypothetical protein